MNKFSMRKMSFVEFQEFVCRLSSATFALDAKVVEKTKSPAIQYMAQIATRNLAVQIVNFLNVWLPNLIPEERREEFTEMMPKIEEVMEEIGEAYDSNPGI